MRNLFDFLSQGLSRSFKVTFTILFIVINVAVITVNTVYINATIERQNVSLRKMVEHLIYYTDEETALTYLEHYGHTHEIYLSYTSVDGKYTIVTETAPSNGDTYHIIIEGEKHGTLVIDNAQSDLFMANLTYLIVINAMLVSLYVVFLLYFNHQMKKQNTRIIKDMRHLQKNIDTVNFTQAYDFEEFSQIERAFEATIRKIKALQKSHRDAIEGLAHGIKTPLTIIRGLVEGIAQNRIEPNEAINTSIEEETQRISALIEKIIEGTMTDAHEVLDMSELVHASIERQRRLFEDKGITLHHDITPKIIVKGDNDALRRVLEHLLQNSLTHTPGGKSVTVRLNETHLEVEDKGSGMTKETLEKAFERAKSSTGSGVGLAIVKTIVDTHGFLIDIDSKIGEGTRVTIRLRS